MEPILLSMSVLLYETILLHSVGCRAWSGLSCSLSRAPLLQRRALAQTNIQSAGVWPRGHAVLCDLAELPDLGHSPLTFRFRLPIVDDVACMCAL